MEPTDVMDRDRRGWLLGRVARFLVPLALCVLATVVAVALNNCTPAQGAIGASWTIKAMDAICRYAWPEQIRPRLEVVVDAGAPAVDAMPAAGGEAMPDAGASE